MECLVEKLKGSVSDTTLPILEVLNAFTLAAIELSGNSSMTDAQKWALNDFFGRLGAFSNSTLWNKLDTLILPVICNKNTATALSNYVDGTVLAAPNDASFAESGGLVNMTNTKVGSYKNNANEISMVHLFTATGALTPTYMQAVGVRDTTNYSFCRYMLPSSGTPAINLFGKQLALNADENNEGIEGFAVTVTGSAETYHTYLFKGTKYERFTTPVPVPDVDYEDGLIIACGDSAHPFGISITAHGLSTDEAANILLWAKELKDAFL